MWIYFSVSRHREYPVRVCSSEGHNFAVEPEGVQLGVGMCGELPAYSYHTTAMIAWTSSLGPVAVREAPWDVWLLKSDTHLMFWKLSSTVCLRVRANASREEHHHLESIVKTALNYFPLDNFFFLILSYWEKIVTPSRLFADNGLSCVRCDGRSWPSFHNTLNTCSAFVSNDFDPFGFVSCTMQCPDKGRGEGCNCRLTDWSFWILLLAYLECP